MNLTNEFYLISKALDHTHKRKYRRNRPITKCVHCNGTPQESNLLCANCSKAFDPIHRVSVYLWSMAASSSSFEEFKLKATLHILGGKENDID